MSSVMPFDDGRRFVVGVRAFVPVTTLIFGIAGAFATNLHNAASTEPLMPGFIYFSVRGALLGYLAGLVAMSLAIVASRWNRWASAAATAVGLGAPLAFAALTMNFPHDFLGLLPPVWFCILMPVLSGAYVAALPHPTLHIRWSTILGRNKYILFARPLAGDLTPEMAELGRRFDDWDPLDFHDYMSADHWPHGDYSDLFEPVIEVLRAGVHPHELARELVAVFAHDYGHEVALADAAPFASALTEWYTSLASATSAAPA